MARRTRNTTSTPAPTVGKSGYALGQRYTDEEMDVLFTSTILPALRGGATMQSQRELYGKSEAIRQAARRAGYASIADVIAGRKGTFQPIKVKGVQPKVVARRLSEARSKGASWNTLKLATDGMAIGEMKALLAKHGHETVTEGRVITTERGKAKVAKAEAEAAAAAAKPKRVRKPRARKPKAQAVEVTS